MKLVCISDTHCMHREIFTPPEGDVLIHAGDMVLQREESAYLDMVDWLNSLPHRYKIIVPGNHDLLFEEQMGYAYSLFEEARDTHILMNEEIVLEGFKFYGAPQQPAFCSWAFNIERGDLHTYWDEIPDDTDVLVTHGPPYGYGDMNFYGRLCGCEELLAALKRVQPQVHVCGHIHEGYGSYPLPGTRTTIINASSCDGQYNPVNYPLSINIF